MWGEAIHVTHALIDPCAHARTYARKGRLREQENKKGQGAGWGGAGQGGVEWGEHRGGVDDIRTRTAAQTAICAVIRTAARAATCTCTCATTRTAVRSHNAHTLISRAARARAGSACLHAHSSHDDI